MLKGKNFMGLVGCFRSFKQLSHTALPVGLGRGGRSLWAGGQKLRV